MASRTSHQDSSSSSISSKRHFHWTTKIGTENDEVPIFNKPSSTTTDEENKQENARNQAALLTPKKRFPSVAVARLRSVLTSFGRNRSSLPYGLGQRVVGTLFGYRRGHVHFAFQKDPNSPPAFLIELAIPISGLIREMASGLVRIALECDKVREEEEEKEEDHHQEKKAVRLLEEPMWRTYCNGKKCGFATRRECGPREWKVLKAVEPISMGAGVLPGITTTELGTDADLIYMRAKFERIVGSRDSEAFYMMNPDSNGAPELSVYLLRV